MIRLRAIHMMAAIVIVAVFIISSLLIIEFGESPVVAMVFSFLNIIGATFPPTEAIVDTENILVLTAVAIGIIGNLAFTIMFTAIFYQVLSRIDIRYILSTRKLRHLSGHVIITPINAMGLDFAKKLKENRIPVVFIDENKSMVNKALKQGMIAVHGDPASSEVLDTARLDKSLVVYTLYDDDIKNMFVTMEARRTGEKAKVISRIRKIEDIPKLEKSGARRVILPEAAVGLEIGEFILSH